MTPVEGAGEPPLQRLDAPCGRCGVTTRTWAGNFPCATLAIPPLPSGGKVMLGQGYGATLKHRTSAPTAPSCKCRNFYRDDAQQGLV